MEPNVSTGLSLQFTSSLSAWWLLLILPVLVVLVCYLYRRQYKGLSRRSMVGLTVLRAFLVCVLAILAFRPDLVFRRVETYAGRIMLLVDDSESMTANDSRMEPAEALRIARSLDPELLKRGATYQTMAEQLKGVERQIRLFQRFTANAQRDSDDFWRQRDRVQALCLDHFKIIQESIGQAPDFWSAPILAAETALITANEMGEEAIGLRNQAKEESERVAANGDLVATLENRANDLERASIQQRRQATESIRLYQTFARNVSALEGTVSGLKAGLQPFFSGANDSGANAYEVYAQRLRTLTTLLQNMQAEVDDDRLAEGNPALNEMVNSVRDRSRLSLVREKLLQSRDLIAGDAGSQFIEITSLMSGKALTVDDEIEAVGGVTDLLGRLQALGDESNPFPLNAVAVLSDGRDLGGRANGAVSHLYSRKQIPIISSAVGAETEPTDLAVLDSTAPPFAVKGREVNIDVRLKTALPAPTSVEIQVLRGSEVVANRTVELGGTPEVSLPLSFSPLQTGVHRYQVALKSVAGEIFPVRNNRSDFALHVREDKIQVLLLDWKPRWETRFALNVFGRLSYVDLNAIIVVSRENAELERGIRRGAWPVDAAALDMYDLVILGDVPAGLLTPAEEQDLARWVSEKGNTLCLLGSGPATLAGGPLAALAPSADTEGVVPELTRPQDLLLSAAGRIHPITRATRDAVGALPEDDEGTALSDGSILLAGAAGSPNVMVAVRYTGAGRVAQIGTDRLWQLLNPTQLEAHTRLFINLITWGLESSAPSPEEGASVLRVDMQRGTTGSPVQVWLEPAGNPVVQAITLDGVIAEATPVPFSAPGLSRYVFPDLPAADIRFQIAGNEAGATAPMISVDDNPELHHVSMRGDLLKRLAVDTGGEFVPFTDLERSLASIVPRQRVEKYERIWRLWDLGLVFTLMIIGFSVEWIWRKFVGLV